MVNSTEHDAPEWEMVGVRRSDGHTSHAYFYCLINALQHVGAQPRTWDVRLYNTRTGERYV